MIWVLHSLGDSLGFFVAFVKPASGIEDVDILVADVADLGSLEAMCARCTVIINCVGPVSHGLAAKDC